MEVWLKVLVLQEPRDLQVFEAMVSWASETKVSLVFETKVSLVFEAKVSLAFGAKVSWVFEAMVSLAFEAKACVVLTFSETFLSTEKKTQTCS